VAAGLMVYRELDATHIAATLERLERRIHERFPDSGLGRVARELSAFLSETRERVERMRRPNWFLRAGVALLIVIAAAILVAEIVQLRPRLELTGHLDPTQLLQTAESALQNLVFVGIALFFLFTLETRLKRRESLAALHNLRSVAHVIDMHQLTKDPELVLHGPEAPTASSPRRAMTGFELARYLDYCSELLACTSKLAALHAQYLNDPAVLSAVNEVETLVGHLSMKVWQKRMILDTAIAPAVATTS